MRARICAEVERVIGHAQGARIVHATTGRVLEHAIGEIGIDWNPSPWVTVHAHGIARAEPSKAHVLRLDRETGRWCCGCFTRVYSTTGTCPHEAAAEASRA